MSGILGTKSENESAAVVTEAFFLNGETEKERKQARGRFLQQALPAPHYHGECLCPSLGKVKRLERPPSPPAGAGLSLVLDRL